jgi:hypothetical protein
MNSENQVPPSIVLDVGDGLKIQTWTILVFILSATSQTALRDEDALLAEGPFHPLPPFAARWIGPVCDIPYVGQSQVGGNRTPPAKVSA